MSAPLVVLDTSVLIAALTTNEEEAASRRLLRAVGTGAIRLALSDDFLREAIEVVRRREDQIVSAALAFEVAIDLWTHSSFYLPTKHEWPSVSDREDYWVPDLAWAARADYITSWDPHLIRATLPFPVEVLEPHVLADRLGL